MANSGAAILEKRYGSYQRSNIIKNDRLKIELEVEPMFRNIK